MEFTKMHGISNDYIYINCMDSVPDHLEDLAVEMSDRHRGVGGDGIILILPSNKADFMMRIFNADGSEAKMCGNGVRCVGKFVYDKGLTTKTRVSVDTLSGIKVLELHLKDGLVDTVTVDMGEPIIDAQMVPVVCQGRQKVEEPVATSAGELKLTAVSMGNPHGVVFVGDLSTIDVHTVGRELELHPMWPDRANIEFAEVITPEEIRMRVWERGSGETMACGTGACATAVAGAITGRCGRDVRLRLLGGDLDIRWDPDNSHVYMTGPAATVFEGVYNRKR
ncbi:MAG: diaminopimelate epimerase [Pseudoflavonifractor sp.]|nr:diaminopimelate epimerase [Pseudoflavonifractor sp.]